MRIGYPCINSEIGCTSNSTFRLSSFSEERFVETVENNLNCLQKILQYNLDHNILFFRIGSGIIPFASHPICQLNWEKIFKKKLRSIGKFVRENNMRISMHPDQFVVLNTKKESVFQNSVAEIDYQCRFLDSLRLNSTAKIVIHVGGLYGDKKSAIERFVSRYRLLSKRIKKRLVVENDDHLFSLKDVLSISNQTSIPIILDTLHHKTLNHGETLSEAILAASESWRWEDGPQIIHYSSQKKNGKSGSHSSELDVSDFKLFLKKAKGFDFDLMLEIKSKEKAAKKAFQIAKEKGFLDP